VLLFGPLSGPAARLDELIAVGRRERELVEAVESLGDSCNTFFPLPGTFDEYLKALGKQHRDNLKRKLAQFSKAHRVSFDVVSHPDKVMAEFDAFRILHNAQWQQEGKLGHFGDWPRAEAFNRDLVRTFGAQGLVRFHRILADDQVVCSQFSFALGHTNYWRLPARACAVTWSRFSFGYLGLVKMFEASIAEGHALVEGGRGHYAYKLHIGGREWPLRTIQFVRKGPGVSARLRLFRAFAALLIVVYFKVIFARLAPRIPPIRHALWPVWIRSNW
jgi:CelD/BcsL family acetyltransferase involved in cellulose biosynthesis